MNHKLDPQRMYKETTVRGATPIGLLVVLFDSAIKDIQRAVAAMKSNDIETRAKEIHHALLVLQQLQGTLDFEQGGPAARQFEQFYNMLRAKLLEAQLKNSTAIMEQQIRYLSEVRNCWIQAEVKSQSGSATPPAETAPQPVADLQPTSSLEWNA